MFNFSDMSQVFSELVRSIKKP